MGKRIMIMAGGTGGHVFPALAVALYLREQGWQVNWIGTRQGIENRVVPENGIVMDWLSISGLRGKGRLAMIKAPLMLLQACLQAASILHKRRPDIALGMGGFVAGPGGLMARLLGIPLIIHEQNRIPGTTNRLLARLAKVVLQAFPYTFPEKLQAICTGNPLRQEFAGVCKSKPPSAEKDLKVLVVGGSQGAKVLNEIVPEALSHVPAVKVRHQTGTSMWQQVKKHYQKLAVDAEVSDFIIDMVAAYQWADLVICRAGAMTLSEIAAMGLPSILIPFPYAIDDHQTANGRFLQQAGASILIPEKQLQAAGLAKQVVYLQNNLAVMSQAARRCARPEATQQVAKICAAEAGL